MSDDRVYEQLDPIDRDEATRALRGDDARTIADALLRVALFDADMDWAEKVVLDQLYNLDWRVQSTVFTALSHLARRGQQLQTARLREAIEVGRGDARLQPRVVDLIEDIDQFLPGLGWRDGGGR